MEAEQIHTNRPSPPPTQAITLRPFNPSESDIDSLIALAADDRINRFLRREPFACRNEALHFLHAHVHPHPWYRAICFPGGGPIGSISLRPRNSDYARTLTVSLGYRVAAGFWGRGIATEAIRMTTAAAFDEWLGLQRVEAVVDVENPASQRVLEKAGFVREAVLRRYLLLKGEIRDMVMYSFVSTDRVVG